MSLLVRMIFLDMCTTATTLQMQREALPEEWAQLLSQYHQQVQVSWQRAKVFCNLHATSFQHSAQDGAFTKPVLDATQPPTDEFANRLAGAQPQAPFRPGALSVLMRLHTDLCFFGWGLCACSRFGQQHSNGHRRQVSTIPALASLSCTSMSS